MSSSFTEKASPLGIPNWCHVARCLPSWSKIWIRVFDRSHTNNRPLLSMPMQCAVRNSPGAYPVFPQALMNFPSFEYLTMRLFEPWPSATKISPLGAVTTPAGDLKWYSFFFFNDTATTEIYTLSLHDALPI